MKCRDCDYCAPFKKEGRNVIKIRCRKYGIAADTSKPWDRQCLEEDYDVIWRAGFEKGERWDVC